ncbi:MAG: hypothetical protein QMD53_03375 [Actinomycetota bacterium]|nr:hypothetical protein [Actinomycetota bacterium]
MSASERLAPSEVEINSMAEELSGVYEELTLLFRLSREFSSSLDSGEIAKMMAKEISAQLKSGLVIVLINDEETGNLEIKATSSGESLQRDIQNYHKVTMGLAQNMKAKSGAVILNDINSPDSPDHIFYGEGTVKLLSAPIRAGGEDDGSRQRLSKGQRGRVRFQGAQIGRGDKQSSGHRYGQLDYA